MTTLITSAAAEMPEWVNNLGFVGVTVIFGVLGYLLGVMAYDWWQDK